MTADPRFTHHQLVRGARHVDHELALFFVLLRECQTDQQWTRARWLQSALLDAAVMRLRRLLEFFQAQPNRKGQRSNDLFAIDFLPNASPLVVWLPSADPSEVNCQLRCHKLAAHITLDRDDHSSPWVLSDFELVRKRIESMEAEMGAETFLAWFPRAVSARASKLGGANLD